MALTKQTDKEYRKVKEIQGECGFMKDKAGLFQGESGQPMPNAAERPKEGYPEIVEPVN